MKEEWTGGGAEENGSGDTGPFLRGNSCTPDMQLGHCSALVFGRGCRCSGFLHRYFFFTTLSLNQLATTDDPRINSRRKFPSTHRHHNREPCSIFANMPRRSSGAILQHWLAHTMEFTALQILLWDDEDCNDVEFLGDLYACWNGLKRRYMVLREQGSGGSHSGIHVLNSLIYRFLDTAFQACFRMGRTSFRQLIHLRENTPRAATIFHPPHRARYISRSQRRYISSVLVGVVLKEHAYHLTLAMVPFRSTHGGYQASNSSCETIYFLAMPTTTLAASSASAPQAQARDILRLCWVSRWL